MKHPSPSNRTSKISTKYSIDQKVLTNSNFKSPMNTNHVSFENSPRDYRGQPSTNISYADEDYQRKPKQQRMSSENNRAKTQLKTIQASEQPNINKAAQLEYNTMTQFIKNKQIHSLNTSIEIGARTLRNDSVQSSYKNQDSMILPPNKDYKQEYQKNIESIVYKYSYQGGKRNSSVDVDTIIQAQRQRKRDALTNNNAGQILQESMRLNYDKFNNEMDTLLHDSTKKSLRPSAVQNNLVLPSISPFYPNQLGSPSNKKSLIFKAQNFEENGSLDISTKELDPQLLGQFKALKNHDLDRFKALQKKQLEFNIDDLRLSEDEKEVQDEEFYETQSFVNEIQEEIMAIENDINNEHEKQSNLDKVQDTFQRMKEFCIQQLNYSYRDANSHIEKLLKKSETEVSPLLKFYNELAKNTRFRMPLKSLLEFDAKMFQRHLQKFKKAHAVEVRWIKKSSKEKAEEMLRKDYERTQKILKDELTIIVDQFNELKLTLHDTEDELKRAYDTINKQEISIMELREYATHTDQVMSNDDNFLGELNMGPGENGGKVTDQINKLRERQMMIGVGTARPIHKEQLLDKPFGFYSTYLYLSQPEKETIMEHELVEYYKSISVDFEDQVQLKMNEIEAQNVAMEQLVQAEKHLQKKIEKLNNHIERLNEMHEREMSRSTTSYQEIIYNQQRQIKVMDTEIDNLKKMFGAEVTIQEKVIQKLLKVKQENEDMIGTLTLTLRIPRLYHKFIDTMGIHEFVQRCMDIEQKEDLKKYQNEEGKRRMKERQEQSLQKYVQKMVRDSYSKANSMIRDPKTKQFKPGQSQFQFQAHKGSMNDLSPRSLKAAESEVYVDYSNFGQKLQIMQAKRQNQSFVGVNTMGFESRTTMVSPSNVSFQKNVTTNMLAQNSSTIIKMESHNNINPINTKRTNIVLAEFTDYNGNFQQITMQLMQRVEADTKKTFELEDFLFHYINEDGITVMCMTDKAIQKKIAFAFLQDVRKTLIQQYSPRELENAKAYGLSTFTERIKEKLVYYNDNPITINDKTDELLRELNGLKDAMVENLDKLIERDGKIEVILQKAESLSVYSKTYRANARKAKNKMRNRRIFYVFMLILILAVRQLQFIIISLLDSLSLSYRVEDLGLASAEQATYSQVLEKSI
ncbi:synaptobrevin vamp-like protein [Stylonychia lemnae]|uniref:Synaptobrevin vamp-like protein n=1 Tax=Stylonychia lemnae TaxID=5949 RepID=A0A077ZZG3_STYLE|nr:synaptobrevin vamp-like protein [Stylonychia lemnae]|eukprot:CDW75315.1 synaptobrevin vamp-like protein [Stylonychia lemnae]